MIPATRKQKFLLWLLPKLKWLIQYLIDLHRYLSNKGIEEHPCWAGGFRADEGVVPQPCDVCEPFYEYRKETYSTVKEPTTFLKIPARKRKVLDKIFHTR